MPFVAERVPPIAADHEDRAIGTRDDSTRLDVNARGASGARKGLVDNEGDHEQLSRLQRSDIGACISDIDSEDLDLRSTEQAVSQGWTPYTTDGLAPIQCDSASLASDVAITGRYADNLRLYCTPSRGTLGYQRWTSWFSEETSPNQALCTAGNWMTGLSCSGDYCDNLSIQCSVIANVTQGSCYWTGEISEEGHYLHFGGSHARGVKCLGSYCDRLSFYVCPAW